MITIYIIVILEKSTGEVEIGNVFLRHDDVYEEWVELNEKHKLNKDIQIYYVERDCR